MDNDNQNTNTITAAIEPLIQGIRAARTALAYISLEVTTSISEINARRTAEEAILAIERFRREMDGILSAHKYIEEALDEDVGRGGVPRKRHLARLYAVAHSPKSGTVLSAVAKDVANEAYRRGYRDERVADVVPENLLREYFSMSSKQRKAVAKRLQEGELWETAILRV